MCIPVGVIESTQRLEKRSWIIDNRTTNRKHPNHGIVEIQNTEKTCHPSEFSRIIPANAGVIVEQKKTENKNGKKNNPMNILSDK